MGGIGADPGGDLARQPTQAFDTLALRPELVVIDDGGEALDARRQRGLAVLIEEELRVGEPRAQHTLVALHDRLRLLCGQVADQQEAVRQPSLRIREREILLVLLHRQDQALLRDLEECPIEGTGVDHGPFDQRGHLVEQRIGHDHRGALGRMHELAHDLGASLPEIREDLAFGLERRRVGVGSLDVDRRAAEEAVSARRATGGRGPAPRPARRRRRAARRAGARDGRT